MKIAIGNDHAGVEIKEKIKDHLTKKGHTVINKGYDGKERVDYPDYIHPSLVFTVTGRVVLFTISFVRLTINGMSFKIPAPAPLQTTFLTGQP